ncbi:hypothetical protein O6H91_03G011600 [Diphasiastrum complanatum]|uniref:Uncharacterized protein n=1 Tax=Diphasiastrum complanatum TaxID=34168 RepID=A0ACC2E3F5_DIPCM|nr:hypothetical protein O6H91_Y281800 [Diphasiastrum complanatum]KAJ7561046.1 hypothetical protein O6H91_03G011600 [Diphasiastrum complanatum]
MCCSLATCCELVLAIILPPIGVFFRYGCGLEFWICLLFTFMGYIPGIIFAVYVILNDDRSPYHTQIVY